MQSAPFRSTRHEETSMVIPNTLLEDGYSLSISLVVRELRILRQTIKNEDKKELKSTNPFLL
jgi:hypothetical protein